MIPENERIMAYLSMILSFISIIAYNSESERFRSFLTGNMYSYKYIFDKLIKFQQSTNGV